MGLRSDLRGVIPPDLLPYVSDRFSVTGSIAVLSLPEILDPFGELIARAIVSRRKNIVSVLRKRGKTTGDSRTARYELLFGNTTVTTHREFGFSYRLDLTGSFFSPRMASERKRVTSQVRPRERVFVPFAGVGPLVVPAAARGADIVAVEKNPDAFLWLNENVILNHVAENCCILNGDALDTWVLPVRSFDRLIIPAPYGMDHVLDTFLPLVVPGGKVHLYVFRPDEELPALTEELEARGLTITYAARCGNVAPGIRRHVFDMAFTGTQNAAVLSGRTEDLSAAGSGSNACPGNPGDSGTGMPQ